MPSSRARWMNVIAMAFLIASLLFSIAFHLLPFREIVHPDGEVRAGWVMWRFMIDEIRRLDMNDPVVMILLTAFLCSSLLIVTSPFFMPVFRASRLLWWAATAISGMAMCGMCGIVFLNIGPEYPSPGLWSLLTASFLNFLGLLFIRREFPVTFPPP